jgi:hypothetical protein
MTMYRRTFNIFAGNDFDRYAQSSLAGLKDAVCCESDDYVLNANEATHLDHLMSTLSVSPLMTDFDHTEASSREEK